MNNARVETLRHVSRYLLIKKIQEANWDEAANVVYNDEAYAWVQDVDGDLPIHLAVKLGCPPRMAQLLLNAHPNSVKIRDKDGYLPIHLAVRHHKGRLWVSINDLVMLIYKAYPGGLLEGEDDANLPLHLALRHRGPDEMIKFLMTECPESLRNRDKYGNVPLHLAIQFEASYLIVFELLKMDPTTAMLTNNNGCYPLHKAAFFNSSIEIMELVLKAYPDAANKQDKKGNLPLHFVYLNAGGPPDEAKLRIWLRFGAASLSIKNKSGSTPLMMFHRPEEHLLEDYM
jgi:ankyrin repeat protein